MIKKIDQNVHPLVSILLPVRNKSSHLASCLESLLAQNYEPLEIIAIDDFSTDDSYAILKKYRKLDKRLKVYRNVKNYGVRLTLNRCVKKAKGQFISFMNPRDYAAKSKVSRQVSYLLQNSKIAAVGTQCFFIDNKGKKVTQSRFPEFHTAIYKTLLHGLSIQPESVMINRLNVPKDLINFTTGTYPTIYIQMLLKLAKYAQIANINANLYFHRNTSYLTLQPLKSYLPYFLTLWIRARSLYNYRPPLSGLFLPLVRQ